VASLSIREIRATNVKIYKATGGSTKLIEYNDIQKDDLDGSYSKQHAEWRALYTQFQCEHVLGTVPYRWEKEHTEATLVEATFTSPLQIVVIDGPMFHDGSVSGADKAAAVKAALGLSPSDPLMVELGRRGKVALVRETEEEWELIVPHALLNSLPFTERIVCRFRRHPAMQITHRWRDELDGAVWEKWEEGVTRPKCIPDLSMGWLDDTKSVELGVTASAVAASAVAAGDGTRVERFVVQDSWDDDEDVELREHLAQSGVPVDELPEASIRTLRPHPSTMVFADTQLVQELLGGLGVVDTYPACLQPLYRRDIRSGRLSELQPTLPFFCKATGSDKTFAARVVRTAEEESACASAAADRPVYVCSVVDFVSEHRLFLAPGRVWGMAEYSEYIIGHRMQNADLSEGTADAPLVVRDATPPQALLDDVTRCAAPLGFVVVDVGCTAEGEWCVVECNPPFALSSYDLAIGTYVDYCVAAWQHIVGGGGGRTTTRRNVERYEREPSHVDGRMKD